MLSLYNTYEHRNTLHGTLHEVFMMFAAMTGHNRYVLMYSHECNWLLARFVLAYYDELGATERALFGRCFTAVVHHMRIARNQFRALSANDYGPLAVATRLLSALQCDVTASAESVDVAPAEKRARTVELNT